MSNVVMLADFEAQHINGGRWGSRFTFTSTAFKTATTNLGQTNSANNLGLGVLFGAGNATSEQVNIASISTFLV